MVLPATHAVRIPTPKSEKDRRISVGPSRWCHRSTGGPRTVAQAGEPGQVSEGRGGLAVAPETHP
jgi:hypothetical protein